MAFVIGLGVIAVAAVGGWYLFRDAPLRAEETFVTGEETHYVSLRIRPDDEGMRRLALATFERAEATFFAGPAVPSWLRSDRHEGWLAMLPATVEWAGDPGSPGAVRVRFEGSHGTARALFRLLRWGASAGNQDAGAPRAMDLAGDVPAIRLPAEGGRRLELAFAGNRLLASFEEGRLESILRRIDPVEGRRTIDRIDGSSSFPREDGWGWTRAESLGPSCRVGFSLRLESEDRLAVRAAPFGGCPVATDPNDRERFARSLRLEWERIAGAAGLPVVERPDVSWGEDGAWRISGRVEGLLSRARGFVPAVTTVPGTYRAGEEDR